MRHRHMREPMPENLFGRMRLDTKQRFFAYGDVKRCPSFLDAGEKDMCNILFACGKKNVRRSKARNTPSGACRAKTQFRANCSQ